MRVRVPLFVIAVIIIILGIVIPEIDKRRIFSKLKSEERSSEIILSIERLRADLINSLWQVEAVFFGLLLVFLSYFF